MFSPLGSQIKDVVCCESTPTVSLHLDNGDNDGHNGPLNSTNKESFRWKNVFLNFTPA